MLEAKNYHSSTEAKQQFLSVSQFKEFRECEARALARIKGEYGQKKSKALDVGQYVHAWSEGALEQYIEANKSSVYKKTGDKGKYDDYVKADQAIAALTMDSLAMKALEGEKEAVLTGTIDGVEWRGMVDVLGAQHFSDLKYVKDFEPIYSSRYRKRLSWIEYWGYDLQMAVYQNLICQNKGKTLEPLIVAVTKETPPDKGIFGGFADDEMAQALAYIEAMQPRIVDVKNGTDEPIPCNRCDYCRSIKRLVLVQKWSDIPA